jgi:hypothetical protein
MSSVMLRIKEDLQTCMCNGRFRRISDDFWLHDATISGACDRLSRCNREAFCSHGCTVQEAPSQALWFLDVCRRGLTCLNRLMVYSLHIFGISPYVRLIFTVRLLSVFVYLSIVLSSSEFYRRFLWHPHSSSTYTSGIPAFYLERAKQFYSSDRRLWATVHASETLFQKMTSIFLRCFSDFSVILLFHHHSHKDP